MPAPAISPPARVGNPSPHRVLHRQRWPASGRARVGRRERRRPPASFSCTASPATAAGTISPPNILAAAGFDVAFLDRRGSGLNGEQMGDVENWQTWIDDVATYRNIARSNPLPTVLCGISWGGKLAAAVARRHPGCLPALRSSVPESIRRSCRAS